MAKAIVIDSTKEELEKEKKKWGKVTSTGKAVFTTGLMASFLAATSGFIDISAIAAVAAAVGLSAGLVGAKHESKLIEKNELNKMINTETVEEEIEGKQK